jgi:hypothetical protein
MAKSEKKISINALDKIIKENYNGMITAEWCGIDVTIKKNLSFKDMLEFVNDVVDSCFQDDGRFMPEIVDFAVKSNILTKYANYSLPDKLDHRYEILYYTDAVGFVTQYINNEQLSEILASIHKKINYLCNTNVINIQKQIMELVSSFEDMQQKTSDIFMNVTPEDVSKVMGAFEDGKLSEEKLVTAYLQKTRVDKEESVNA